MTDTIEEYLRDIEVIENNIEYHNNKLDELKASLHYKVDELQKVCPHTEVYEIEEFVSGTYFEKAEYITKSICQTCGLIVDTYIKTGYYG